MIDEREKRSKQPPPASTARAANPCPTIIQISRTPWHWKLTQHHRTTRPANNVDPDQMSHFVASDSGLDCLLFAYGPFTGFQVRMG